MTGANPGNVGPVSYVAGMDEINGQGDDELLAGLFADLPSRRQFRIAVELVATAGPGDTSAAGFLESLNQVAARLEANGVQIAALKGGVWVTVLVTAANPVAALMTAADAVSAAVQGRRLEVRLARVTGTRPAPAPTAR